MTEALQGDIITDEMLKKAKRHEGRNGGIEFRVKDAHYLADWLCEKGYIEDYHLWDCQCFMDLRGAYEAFFGVRWGGLRYTAEANQLSGGDAVKIYDAIRREIGVIRAGELMPIVIHALTAPHADLPDNAANVYRVAIETISNAVSAVNKKRDEILLV